MLKARDLKTMRPARFRGPLLDTAVGAEFDKFDQTFDSLPSIGANDDCLGILGFDDTPFNLNNFLLLTCVPRLIAGSQRCIILHGLLPIYYTASIAAES